MSRKVGQKAQGRVMEEGQAPDIVDNAEIYSTQGLAEDQGMVDNADLYTTQGVEGGEEYTTQPISDGANYDYSELLNTTDTSDSMLAGVGAGLLLLYLAFVVFMLAAMWKLFTKAGKPGWASLIPIYNTYVMLQIVGRPWWWLLLMLVPFVNIVVAVIVTNDLSKSFGKDAAWTVGLILLPFIFYPILAFGKAKYGGPAALAK